MSSTDTIAAIATAPGKAGVAVVRVSGGEAFAIASTLTRREICSRGMYYAKIYAPEIIDDCVVLAFEAPHSYTGEHVVEFQGHGGAVTPRRILEACFAAGA